MVSALMRLGRNTFYCTSRAISETDNPLEANLARELEDLRIGFEHP